MRKIKILDVGPYPRKLNVGDEQDIFFVEGDDGPFGQWKKKYNSFTGETKVVEKTKKKLIKNFEREEICCER